MGTLTAMGVKNAKSPGWYGDGRGLWLHIRTSGTKAWVLRYKLHGRARNMGLGPWPEVTLEQARQRALEARSLLKNPDGPVDPIDERRKRQAEAKLASGAHTFEAVSEIFIRAHSEGWRNEKHKAQWESTLVTYAYPVIGRSPVQLVDTDAILRILEPIWRTKTETATRVRQRMENVLDYAGARKMRKGENPARWRGHLDKLLPAPSRLKKEAHHPALPHGEIGTFMASLRDHNGIGACAFELGILTATRTGEVVAARWEEFDLEAAIWTIPAARMKAGKEHRVPLCSRSIEIIKGMESFKEDSGGYVFPGNERGKAISTAAFRATLKRMGRSDITPHGFRSTFRDWAGEETAFPREVIEHAMAHRLKDKAEAAYQRGDLFKKRRKLMEAWAARCHSDQTRSAKVEPIRNSA